MEYVYIHTHKLRRFSEMQATVFRFYMANAGYDSF